MTQCPRSGSGSTLWNDLAPWGAVVAIAAEGFDGVDVGFAFDEVHVAV
jgi:hypothetical protein